MAQGHERGGGHSQNPQYPTNYGQAGKVSQHPQSYPTNHEQARRAAQNLQPYPTDYEQAGRTPQNPQLYAANYAQAGKNPQNTQSYPTNYEQAGRAPKNPQSYPTNYGQAGRVPQDPQLYAANTGQAGEATPNPTNRGQAGGTSERPQLYSPNYAQTGGAAENPQPSSTTFGQAGAPAQNPHLRPQNYGNPITALFTVLFKGSAIVFYIFCGWLTTSFVIHFVIVSMLMAFDFWTMKNVSGRILVGMRWWNDVDEEGQSVWRFESLDRETLARMNSNDSWLFWWSLYITFAVWIVLGVVALLKFSFDYLLLVCISISLCSANIVGFTKCRKDAKQKVQSFAQSAMAAGMREAMTGGITRGLQSTLGL